MLLLLLAAVVPGAAAPERVLAVPRAVYGWEMVPLSSTRASQWRSSRAISQACAFSSALPRHSASASALSAESERCRRLRAVRKRCRGKLRGWWHQARRCCTRAAAGCHAARGDTDTHVRCAVAALVPAVAPSQSRTISLV
jgi:hypothetical protein